MKALVYVLPVHNEEKLLEANVARLSGYLERLEGASIYLVENGSTDESWAIAQRLAEKAAGAGARTTGGGSVAVRAFREVNAGIGFAYHRGLTEAIAEFGPSAARWAVLTAADLPFGFSDLESALTLLDRPEQRILMGSKAHDQSRADTGLKRQVMSAAYRIARRAVLGMEVGDSQGSVFIRLDLADQLLPMLETRGFFYSTELCHFAERRGESIVELPVVLEEQQRGSTVKPLRHSAEMAKQLWALRKRAPR
jgi:dolichyl-phosphate beta-glucosyltransferase